MVGRRGGRILDKFPQQVHNVIRPGVAAESANSRQFGLFTEVEWSVPVTLSLRGSTLLEAGTISADLVYDDAVHTYTQPAAPDQTTIAGMDVVRVWVMNERRTAVPTEEDNAVLAYFEYQVLLMSMGTAATTATHTIPKVSGGPHKVIELEDLKTGQGALVAQPTIYIYSQILNISDAVATNSIAWAVRVTLHYRNVETPSGEEFVTELMAKFT